MLRKKDSLFVCALPALIAIAGIATPALAGEPAKNLAVDSGDTSFVMISAALVLFMTVGLAFFYGGLVRRKNVLSILMQCFFAMGVLTLQWIFFGYSISFGPDINGLIGSMDWAGLKNVGLTPSPVYASTVPHLGFMVYQGMFAIITPALIIGAFAERMKFSAYAVFILLWAIFVYEPVCHWVWGGGFLGAMGTLDFAGGIVVHVTAGIAGLICAIMMGKRLGFPERAIAPHNIPFSVLGAGILWFGWFGFNAGSALAANGTAVGAFVATNTAAAAAAVTWACIEWFTNGQRPTMLGTITGSIAGLAAVTPAAGFVGPMSAAIIGFVSSLLCYVFVAVIKPKAGYDDSLDVFGVHGIGGIWGSIAVGLFACKAVNAGGADGLFFGNASQLIIQLKAVGLTVAYSVVVTAVILKVVDIVLGLRVEQTDERIGADLTQHHERGYTLID